MLFLKLGIKGFIFRIVLTLISEFRVAQLSNNLTRIRGCLGIQENESVGSVSSKGIWGEKKP